MAETSNSSAIPKSSSSTANRTPLAPTPTSPSAYDEILSRFDGLKKNTAEIEENARKFKDSINKNYSFLDQQVGKIKAQQKTLKEIKESLKAIKASPKEKEDLQQKLGDISEALQKLRVALTPRTGSLFVRLFLGKVNVKQYRDGERLRLKQEYQKFKRKTDPLFLAFVIALIFVRHRALEIMFQVWLLYYYLTLALRENILQVNGSNIKNWWIYHHYISIAVSFVILTWPPESEPYHHFLPQFLYFSLLQGLVQILQNRYQSDKLYKAIALGQADTMDVTGEGLLYMSSSPRSVTHFSPSISVLLPFLLFVQCFQIYNGYCLLEQLMLLPLHTIEWQVVACGILFVSLGVGNLYNTLVITWKKYKQPTTLDKTKTT